MSGNYGLLILLCIPFAGAFISYVIGRIDKEKRNLFAIGLTIAEFLTFLALFISFLTAKDSNAVKLSFSWKDFCGLGMNLTMDGFRALYCLIAAFMWMMTTLLSEEYFKNYRNRNRYYLFLLLTLGATIGVFLSADLFTTFIFFEIMSFTSYVWVVQDEKEESMKAGATYLAVAVIGGLVMLMGLFLLYNKLGTLSIDQQAQAVKKQGLKSEDLYVAGGCILFGFAAKAGAFPLHIWLPKAHPVAPAPASALLSGILTKTGIFGVLVLSGRLFLTDEKWGSFLLLVGMITMFLGALLALFSVNLKRILACSSVSQIGFILVGTGMMSLLEGGRIAARGTLLHMINHSLLKLVLFMAAGVVFMNIHKLDLNEIRGFGHKKPLLHFAFLMGALGIGGIPLFNGYVSKSLIHEAIVEYSAKMGAPVWITLAEWIFLLSGGLTIAYMGKLYGCLFAEKNDDPEVQKSYDDKCGSYMNKKSAFALTVSAVFLLVLGVVPNIVNDRLADLGEAFLGVDTAKAFEKVSYFSLENLKGAAISMIAGAVLYFLVVRKLLMKKTDTGSVYVNRWPAWLDLENLVYRPVVMGLLPLIGGTVSRILDRLVDGTIVFLRKTIYKDSKIPYEPEEGNALTEAAGSFMDGFASIFHYKTNYKHKFAMIYSDLSENSLIIARSLSFGLLLACLGLIAVLIYLLI